jgi:hypothetical protein
MFGIAKVFTKIAKPCESQADTKEVRQGCSHLFWSAPPLHSLAEIAQWTETISVMIKSKQSFNVESPPSKAEPGRVGVFEVRNEVTSRAICRSIKYR